MGGVGEWVVRASVWLALVCYPAGPWGAWVARTESGLRIARLLWSCGCAVFAVHVVSAYHVFYEWSQAEALSQTAQQAREATGMDASWGLYLNYAFAVLWIVDVGAWWRNAAGYVKRRFSISAGLHAFFLFMIVNGAIVFATGGVRVLGALVTLATIGMLVVARPWQGRPG